MCPWMWFTGISGRRRRYAMALAAASPTSSAPMRPGPCVVAMAARSSQPTPAAPIASATTSFTSSVWRREATSGTTPPNCACSSFCDDTMDESTSRPRTTAALVSSHEVSTHSRGPAGGAATSGAPDVRPVTRSPLPSPST